MYIPRYGMEKNFNPSVLIFTGAGISAESGISTFRDTNGLWDNHNIEEICNINTWEKNNDLVKPFYNQRRTELKLKSPNVAHKIISKISKEKETLVFTQNIDDLLDREETKNLTHLHGELTKMQCQDCFHRWDIGYTEYKEEKCPNCNSERIKPFVVFFGEGAPEYSSLSRALAYFNDPSKTIIVSGTSGTVIDITRKIKDLKCKKILNNLEPNKNIDDTFYDYVFYESATSAWKKIEKLI